MTLMGWRVVKPEHEIIIITIIVIIIILIIIIICNDVIEFTEEAFAELGRTDGDEPATMWQSWSIRLKPRISSLGTRWTFWERERERQTDRERKRERQRHTEIERERERERQTDRQAAQKQQTTNCLYFCLIYPRRNELTIHANSLLQRQFAEFVLRFCDPLSPVESCRARSVYLTTLLLGRLCPLSV